MSKNIFRPTPISIAVLLTLIFSGACQPPPSRPTTVDLRDRDGRQNDDDVVRDNKDPIEENDDPEDDPVDPVDPEVTVDPVDPEPGPTIPEKPIDMPEIPVVTPDKPVVVPDKPVVGPDKPKDPTVRELFTEAQFNSMLPNRIPFYTYQGFIEAAEATPKFAKTGSIEIRKREIAALLANALHESDDFKAVREYDQANWPHYCMATPEYPCKAGQTYQGRGPIQISWNYNYINAGKALGVDLYNNPDLVATDPKIAFQTLMWFWTTQGATGLTCHDAIVNNKGGFAQTIKTINGGLECDRNSTNPIVAQQRAKRISNYQKTLALFGLEIGSEKTNCLDL